MKPILCHICGHDINRHRRGGCWGEDKYHVCKTECNLTPADIAAHAVAAAVSEAREVIEQAKNFVDDFGGHAPIMFGGEAELSDACGLWLAAHTEPKLPKAVSWDEAMQGRERDFNKRYYNNPDGEPKFPHEV